MSNSSLLDRLAAVAHDSRRRHALAQGCPFLPELDKSFEQLSPENREAKRAAVLRVIAELASLGLKLAPASPPPGGALDGDTLARLIEENMPRLEVEEHEGWMRQYLDEGWRYAPQRDDARKLHPCLVPFEELSELEKKKDRVQLRTYPRLLLEAGLVAVRA